MATSFVRPLPELVRVPGLFLRPPAYTRLEPQSITGDPTPGVAATLHDPLWSLFRQWQVGEFCGEDAGTPLTVTIGTAVAPVTLFAAVEAGPGETVVGEPIGERAALDRQIETEPPATTGPGSRARAEAAQVLVTGLTEIGLTVADGLASRYPFSSDAIGANDSRAVAMVIASSADAEQIAKALELGAPDWLTPGGEPARAASAAWLSWYRTNVSPLAGSPSWDRSRLEYNFSIATDAGPTQQVFTAPAHLGGDIDWYSLDSSPGAVMSGAASLPRRPRFDDWRRRPLRVDPTMLVAPLRFAGMPADRFWEFEDGQVNLGATSVQRNDPARLCLIEFATIYGCDWFLVPLDIPASGFTTLRRVTVTDTFGEKTEIERADDGVAGARFRMFSQSVAGRDEALPGLLTVAAARGTVEGPPLESVLLLRDETANMAWAIEDRVETPSGATRSRRDEARPITQLPPIVAGADLRYTLETQVPRHWIPFVPTAKTPATGGFVLRKGTMTEQDDSVGRILAGKPVDLYDEEVPRGGIRVSRTPSLGRDGDGRPIRWVALRVGEGSGELESGFASDKTTGPNEN